MKLKFTIDNQEIGQSNGEFPNQGFSKWHEIVKEEKVPSNTNIFTNYKLTLLNGSYVMFSIVNTIEIPNLIGKNVVFHNDGIEIR